MTQRKVKSAERVLLMLEHFAEKQAPSTISELSRELGYPQPSVTMLVRTLVNMGYLIFEPDTRTYLPSMRVAILGTWLRRRFPETGSLPRLIQELSEELGLSVALAMRTGIYAQYIIGQEADSPLSLHVRTGFMVPLACSAPGWALLQYLPDREVDLIARRTQLEAPVAHWRETAKSALDNVKLTRQRHYAISSGETRQKIAGIAIALPPVEGSPQLSITVGGSVAQVEREKEEIIRAIRHTIDSMLKVGEAEMQSIQEHEEKIRTSA